MLGSNTRLRLGEVEKYFQRFFKVVPMFLKGSFKNKPIILCARHGGGADYFKVDVHKSTVCQITEAELVPSSIQFETAALILRKAMALNMFSHIGISKRVAYKSRTKDARHIRKFNELLAAYEYEALPLRRLFSLRTLRVLRADGERLSYTRNCLPACLPASRCINSKRNTWRDSLLPSRPVRILDRHAAA